LSINFNPPDLAVILTLGFQSVGTGTDKGTPASVEGPGDRIKWQWELGLTYLKFPKRKTFNLKLRKFREEGQMEQKFPVIVQTFWYTSHGCPVIEENEAGNGIEVRKIVSSIKQNLQILIYFLGY